MQGVTPLHAAAHFDNVTAVRWLLRHDADINAKDNKVRNDIFPVSICTPFLCLTESTKSATCNMYLARHSWLSVCLSDVMNGTYICI